MSAITTSQLVEFHRFVGAILQDDESALLSPEEVLVRWKEKQRSLEDICEGIADIEAGRTVSLDEFDREFRARHGIKEVT